MYFENVTYKQKVSGVLKISFSDLDCTLPIVNKNYYFGIFKVKYLESHYYLISSTTASAVVRLLTKFAVIAIASFPRNSFLLNYSLVMGCTII